MFTCKTCAITKPSDDFRVHKKANLRWACAGINYAKRDLSDADLLALCSDVMAWIGRRIEAVQALP